MQENSNPAFRSNNPFIVLGQALDCLREENRELKELLQGVLANQRRLVANQHFLFQSLDCPQPTDFERWTTLIAIDPVFSKCGKDKIKWLVDGCFDVSNDLPLPEMMQTETSVCLRWDICEKERHFVLEIPFEGVGAFIQWKMTEATQEEKDSNWKIVMSLDHAFPDEVFDALRSLVSSPSKAASDE